MPLESEPCIFFEYSPGLVTGYIGSPEIAIKKQKDKLIKEINSIVLYNIIEVTKLKQQADPGDINRLCLFWQDAGLSKEVACFIGYSDLCEYLVKFFKTESEPQDNLEYSFKNFIPLELAHTVFKDFQKKLTFLKG
jgi:hypothetical protein